MVIGLSAIPGYAALLHVLGRVRWPWILASAGGVVLAFAGYVLAWQGIARAGGGLALSRRQRLATVLVGFGGFISRAGSSVDRYAFLATGTGEREADVRIVGLDALEHVPLAVACCVAAIAGTAVYRFFSLFAPMPFCFAALPTLRGIGGEQNAPSDEAAVQPRQVQR